MTIKKLICATTITMDVLCAYMNFRRGSIADTIMMLAWAILVYIVNEITEVR